MTAVSDSVIFGNILSTPESAAIWSDKTRTKYYLEFESALASAQARLKIIPQKAAEEITRYCRIEEIDWDELRQQTELIGYPVLPVVKQLVRKVNAVEAGLGEWAHWGATTQVSQRKKSAVVVASGLEDHSDNDTGRYRHSNSLSTPRYP